MILGEILNKAFMDAGVKADDPVLKTLLSDPELNKEVTPEDATKAFKDVFLTFSEAKSNKAIEGHFQKTLRDSEYGKFISFSESTIKNWAKENGLNVDEINEVFKSTSDQKERWPKILNMVAEAKAGSGKDGNESEKLTRAYEEITSLKREKEALKESLTQDYESKISNLQKTMLKKDIKLAIDSKIKFAEIPDLDILKDAKVEKLLSEYHIIQNTSGGFEFFTKDDPKRKAVDEKGKEIEFDKAVSTLFDERYLAKSPSGNGKDTPHKTVVTTGKEGITVNVTAQEKISANEAILEKLKQG